MLLAAQHGTDRAGAESASEENRGGKCSEITFSTLPPAPGMEPGLRPCLGALSALGNC